MAPMLELQILGSEHMFTLRMFIPRTSAAKVQRELILPFETHPKNASKGKRVNQQSLLSPRSVFTKQCPMSMQHFTVFLPSLVITVA